MGEGTKAWVGATLFTALLMGGLFVYGRHERTERREHGPAQLESVAIAHAQRPLWVALETQEEGGGEDGPDVTVWRMSVYELDSGRLLTRKTDTPWRRCVAASDGRLWCVGSKDELEVLSVPGLEVLHPAAEVQQKVGQKLMDASRLEVSARGALRSMLADGRTVELEPDTLAVAPASRAPREDAHPPFPPAFRDTSVCGLPDSGRSGLCRGYQGPRQDTGDGFLRPDPLREPGMTNRLAVLSHTSLDRENSALQLTLLDEQFKPVAQRELTKGDPALLRSYWVPRARTLVLGFRPPANLTVGIDVDSGAEKFRIAH